MPVGISANQEFLKFITVQKTKGKLGNLEMLMDLERNYSGIFIKVMSNFKDAKRYRECLDENGKPIKISWEEALTKFYFDNKYLGVTEKNSDIAKLFGGKGLSQEIFEIASNLRKKAQSENVAEHILGKQVKEETILESIERIKNETDTELRAGKEMIEELYEKQFTYEWISKNDPHNSIMGLFCSCCGTITSSYYGEDIAIASVIVPNVQNLVVRNFKGDIISKGTMYVNREKGYAVINDFELNEQYRHHESENYVGKYNVNKESREEQEREMIFGAFKRGLQAFIEEYDRQNPNNPLTQINIGMGYNRLKRQVEQFKKATVNLTVPAEYSFQDAMKYPQYTLYKREEKQTKNGEIER
ncbi:MAG: hypothetical protein Q4G09_02515 [Clostridia bacterium]|nr:hypothetical protein [Clostridia bacterium]